MVNSMTGFASLAGADETARWTWEVRSVNARGLDVRLRLPEGCEALEPVLRKEIGKRCARGNVNLTLRLHRERAASSVSLNQEHLRAVIGAAKTANDEAQSMGLALERGSDVALLAVPGVIETASRDAEDAPDYGTALQTDVGGLLDAFAASRRDEGQALGKVLATQIDQVGELVIAAQAAAEERKPKVAAALKENVQRLLETADGLDEARLAQELAILAVKSDVTEELDRLRAHVDGAKELLAATTPIGRKFDFLTQEFNREANTLCSKAGTNELTKVGLELKSVIDQMREQVQNVE